MFCAQAKATRKSGIYVRDNPVRAGLISSADDWPYAGEIETLML
jgi:hypothetical protein